MRVFNGYIKTNKKQVPQYLIIICDTTQSNYSFEKLGKTFKLQKELLKTETNHDESYADDCRDKKDERVDYVKNDVLSAAFSYARYSKAMEEVTAFSMKDCF